MSERCRIRDLLPKLHLGDHPPGKLNSITDVSGVLVHTKSITSASGCPTGAVNTGITTILPRKDFYHSACHSGLFRFNGSGEMTGAHIIDETGLLASPIILTNSLSIGAAHTGVYEYCIGISKNEDGDLDEPLLPVVAETYDGYLNKISAFAVTPKNIVEGIEMASSDPVPEGNTGGGTGMMCHFFKGGTGSASRVVAGDKAGPGGKDEEISYTVGVLVQANYGKRSDLRIAGVPIGRIIEKDLQEQNNKAEADLRKSNDQKDGSIIVVIATDAPLHPLQLQRLAKRATVGLARVGGQGHNLSGDIFLAFSTAQKIAMQPTNANRWKPKPYNMETIDDSTIDSLFVAVAEAVEESIYNALFKAQTMVGYKEKKVEAIDLEDVKEIMEKHQMQRD